MYTNVNLYDFERAFVTADRKNNFSYAAKKELFAFFEEIEEDGNQIELDVIAICCEWREKPLQDVLDNYNLESFEELQDNTICFMIDENTVLYEAY